MAIIDLCTNNVVTISKDKNLYEAACLMQKKQIGCLVVLQDGQATSDLVGMVT